MCILIQQPTTYLGRFDYSWRDGPFTDAWLPVPILARRSDSVYVIVPMRRSTVWPENNDSTFASTHDATVRCRHTLFWRKTTQCDNNSRKRLPDVYRPSREFSDRDVEWRDNPSSVTRRHCSSWIRRHDVLDPTGIYTYLKWSSRVEMLSCRLWLFLWYSC